MKNKIRIIIIIGIIIVILGVVLFIGTHTGQLPVATNNSPGNTSITSIPVIQTDEGNKSNRISPSPKRVITVTTNDNVHNLEMKYQMQKEPDLFLSNALPYETGDFAASSAFTTTPSNHFYFIILVKDGNTTTAMQKFQEWLQSLGLDSQQIAQLDIRYQTQ